ncbi:hypothetical protein BV898_11424 [Hypsibius exemplaris]|uniref:Uncharacterized protein n=1 Tax=Hypsibius exemplaris TaxID=2072580 RepID=A0A1W0WGX1_HYPEX|nr:hypothetical protein BV898_11424 [Hypsibius exemplaris]
MVYLVTHGKGYSCILRGRDAIRPSPAWYLLDTDNTPLVRAVYTVSFTFHMAATATSKSTSIRIADIAGRWNVGSHFAQI